MSRGGYVEPLGLEDEEALTRKDASQVLRRLWAMLEPFRGKVWMSSALLFVQTACLLAGPVLVQVGIDHGITPRNYGVLNAAAIGYLCAAILAFFVSRRVILVVATTGELFLRQLRENVFRHLMSLGLDYFETERTGRLVSRMTSDIDALDELVQNGLVSLVQNGLTFVGALIVIFILSWQLALVVCVVVPPVVAMSIWFRNASNRAYLEVRDSIGLNLATLQEGLAGVRVVQAFSRERSFVKRFRQTNEAQYDANLNTLVIAAKYFPFVEFMGVFGIGLIVGVGGWFNANHIVTVGTVAAFVLYLSSLFEPVQQLSQLYNTIQSAGAALKKLFELLDTDASIAEKANAVPLPKRGAVEVNAVSFRYHGGPLVLHDVSITVAPGERVALVGPTGAGKSTLAKLMARFYDPVEGAVVFGGVDLREATLASLRERIVVVPQEGYLFSGTIADNVRVGRPGASDEEIHAAIDILGLRERFDGFSDGIETVVRERGSSMSAGERQLVSLVRAALADPALLVLDEATSSLDPGTEHAVEQALERLMEGRTVVVVAHRLSTAARADRVAVIDGGALVELGTHDELLARDGRYASMFAAWAASSTRT
jgi:ATP-binding cassette subfamily B protein